MANTFGSPVALQPGEHLDLAGAQNDLEITGSGTPWARFRIVVDRRQRARHLRHDHSGSMLCGELLKQRIDGRGRLFSGSNADDFDSLPFLVVQHRTEAPLGRFADSEIAAAAVGYEELVAVRIEDLHREPVAPTDMWCGVYGPAGRTAAAQLQRCLACALSDWLRQRGEGANVSTRSTGAR